MTIIAQDKAILYALKSASGEVVFSGTLPVGQCIATSLTPVASSDGQAVANAMADKLPPLPDTGALVAGELYRYNGVVVQVRQSHQRTIYPPEQTPALFNIWRPEVPGQPWIAGEQVSVGTRRTYGGVLYECLQAHVAQADWTPPVTPALWKKIG